MEDLDDNDDDDDDYVICWQCGGDGYLLDADDDYGNGCECGVCGGNGGWTRRHKREDK